MKFRPIIHDKFKEKTEVLSNSLQNFINISDDIYNLLEKTIKNKKNIFTCGNGGSASDALHFSGEFVSKFKSDKRKPINCICLNSNISAITSIANDFDYNKIFSRQLKAHGDQGDLLFLFSTSGKSKNIIDAAKLAKKKKIKIILFTGSNKTNLHEYCDLILQISSCKTDLIQEAHIFFYHLICEFFEEYK